MNKDLIKYLDNIKCDFNIIYDNFDLIFSGGGFKGFYHIGICKILKDMENNNKIKIRYIIGTSTGAISAINYACNIEYETWIQAYYTIKQNITKSDLHNCVIDVFQTKIPKNAYELCNGKVKIAVSKLTLFGFEEELIDYFESNEHLINVLSAAIKIPFLTSKSIFGIKIKKDIYYDAFFNRITPIIYNNDIPQLVVKTYDATYPSYLILKPADSFIELLSLRGLYETHKFLKYNNKNKTILWVNKGNIKQKGIIEKNLYLIIPILFWFLSKKELY